MKICIAQIRPVKGDILANISKHKILTALASEFEASAIFFPELSLTGYEPTLAKELASDQHDNRLDVFQQISDNNKITIGLGYPTKEGTSIRISMIIFQPDQPRQIYSKQQLHSDEISYFECGTEQILITPGQIKIAPAICYESLQSDHSDYAVKIGAEMYVTSVAKSQSGMNKALLHYPAIAKKYSIPVLMSNCVGYCDNFNSVGQSAIWNIRGELIAQLDDHTEGILLFNTETEEVIKRNL